MEESERNARLRIGKSGGNRVMGVRSKPQISPLRYVPVEMTIHLGSDLAFPNKFVISTGAKRSGEICGSLDSSLLRVALVTRT